MAAYSGQDHSSSLSIPAGGGRTGSGIAIVAPFLNEAEYLPEWIAFHLLVGVDHFYLYDNGSTDDFRKVIASPLAEGAVTVVPWRAFVRGMDTQLSAYAHAVANFGPAFEWFLFVHVDEFDLGGRGDVRRRVEHELGQP